MAIFKQVQAVILSITVAAATPVLSTFAASGAGTVEPQSQQGMPASSAAPSGKELQQIVAPIALYPDALVAQVLAGSTYPNEVVAANQWLQQHQHLKGEQLAAEVDKQSWDPSIKALSEFPSVLANMSTNLSWTSALGDAYFNDPDGVMSAIQTLRREAQSSGHLNSTPQQTVTSQGDTIIIEPSNPQVVYVPEYSPESVYGYPIAAYPGYSGWGVAAASALSFGAGVAVGAAGHWGWGWNSWGTNWHGGNVQYNRNTYVSRSNTFVNRNATFNNANLNNVNRANVNRANNAARSNNLSGTNAANAARANAGNLGARSTGQFNRSGAAAGAETRAKPSQPMNRDAASQAMSRGFGSADRSSMGRSSGAFGGFSQGGAARMDSARGSSSFGGARGGGGGFRGGGGGGGFRGGGGGRR